MSHLYNENLPDCYIYLYHTDECFIIPQYPDAISDSLDSNFASQNSLARTAPVFSYINSGPRQVQVSIKLHRDLMRQLNLNGAKIHYNSPDGIITTPGDDYVDLLIKKLQAVALPKYNTSDKMVEPPMVAVQFGEDVFIKGVVNGGITVTYDRPVLSNNKYAQVSLSFNVQEVQAYDAESIQNFGTFRGLTSGLRKKMFPEENVNINRAHDIMKKNYNPIKR